MMWRQHKSDEHGDADREIEERESGVNRAGRRPCVRLEVVSAVSVSNAHGRE